MNFLNIIMKKAFVEKREYDEDLLVSIFDQYEINKESILKLLKDKVDINPGNMPLLTNALFILVFVNSYILQIQKHNH